MKPEKYANEFYYFLTSITKHVTSQIPKYIDYDYTQSNISLSPNLLFLTHVEYEEVTYIITNSGYDDISSSNTRLKESCEQLIALLTYLINL